MLRTALITALLTLSSLAAAPATTTPVTSATSPTLASWRSPATGTDIPAHLLLPDHFDPAAPTRVVVYMKNLSVPRLGTDPDASILSDLRADGDAVLLLDYAHHPKAVSPDLNADVLQLRTDIDKHHLLGSLTPDRSHIFFLAEGYRLRRNVEFYRDGSRVLGMDIQYPSHPAHPVPALMEITCDNANRWGNFSILFCHDTLLDGAMFCGFASAMIDHPVAPPYKGLDDPMPQLIFRLKAAVRTLRSLSPELGLSGQVGAIGFSRGAECAALLAVTNGRPDLEGDGPHPDVSSSVQAALVHGARYDYTALTFKDPMFKRFEKAYGPREASPDVWARHGVCYYLPKDAASARSVAPLFLNTSNAESPEFRDGLALFDQRLTALQIPHTFQLDNDNRGHHVSTDPATLTRIYTFFHTHLDRSPAPAR